MAQELFPEKKAVIYTDGGARGNPGPAALGAVIGGKAYGEYLGTKTNNEAEYAAVIFGLRKLKALIGKAKARRLEVEVRSDSELLVRQMNRKYKIEEPHLKPLFADVWNATLDFKRVDFVHVRREENKLADRKVNETLDAHA